MTRLISALGLITILAGGIVSAVRHEEIYLMAPVALCAELGANFSEAALGNWGVALLWLVVCFALVFGNLGLATALSFIMLLIGNPGRILLRLSAVAFCALGVIITVGLLSVQERHNRLLFAGEGDPDTFSNQYYSLIALGFSGICTHPLAEC